MGEKKTRAKYTLEFKMEALRLIKGGQSVSDTAKILGVPKGSLENWIRWEKALMDWNLLVTTVNACALPLHWIAVIERS